MNSVKLCDIDLDKCKKNRISDIFGDNDSRWYDTNLSKSLSLNNEIIGGYLLKEYSLITNIYSLKIRFQESDITDLKFYLSEEELNVYENKIGIYSNFLYIDEKYRNKKMSKYLIDYSLNIGDYVWGISDINSTSDFWLKKQNRIIIATYKEELGDSMITSTII